jgi:uncharacterized protein YqeY
VASLVDTVAEELKKAMLARDAVRTSGYRMIRAAFIELAKEGKGEVTDERCMEALRRLKKQREDSITEYEKAGRTDLADQERIELSLVDDLLPKLADEDTTRAWVKEAIAASGASGPREMGKAMGALMKAHKADIDATLARRLLEEELGK